MNEHRNRGAVRLLRKLKTGLSGWNTSCFIPVLVLLLRLRQHVVMDGFLIDFNIQNMQINSLLKWPF